MLGLYYKYLKGEITSEQEKHRTSFNYGNRTFRGGGFQF